MALDARSLDGRVLGAALREVRQERGAADNLPWTWAVAAMLVLSVALAFVPLWQVDGKRFSAAAVLWEVLRSNASTQGVQP
jgi:predicted lysophospholipase L1 biosynthesis ABC-type transport system permease subunit